MYNTLMKKLIWGVRQFAILNLHFFDWETACFIICRPPATVAEDRKMDQVTHLALRLGVKNADIGTLEVSFFILNIYHNPVILNID